jgi:hypothetical protein
VAQAWRPTVGRPLSSNVRQHTQALRCASISIQRLRMAAVGSIQSVEPFCVASVQVAAVPNTRLASNAALTSFGVREFCRWFAYRQNPKRSCWWQSMSTQSLGSSGRPFWPLIAKLLAKKVVVAFPAWLLRVARAGCMPGRGRPNPGGGRLRFSYSWAMQARSAALPNPSVKRSANIASHWPSSAGAAPHFALAVQHATLLATAYLKR